jgi:hypothetical protein
MAARPAEMPTATPRLDRLLPGESHAQLCLGDTIALCVQRAGRFHFVGSEGFVEVGCSLREVDLATTVAWTQIDCLWMVTQKHQYDAHKHMRRHRKQEMRRTAAEAAHNAAALRASMRRTNSSDGKSGGAKSATSHVFAERMALEREQRQRVHAELRATVRAEQAANAARLTEKRGTPVTYGETIQLYHLKSHKMLMLQPKRRSQALGCYSVRLEAEGSEDSWLTVAPRHSFQFEGGAVYNHDLLSLSSDKRQIGLHVGTSESVAGLSSSLGGPAPLSGAPSGDAPMGLATVAGPAIPLDCEVNAAASPDAFQLLILKSAANTAAGHRGNTAATASGGGHADADGAPAADGNGSRATALGTVDSPLITCGDIIALYHCDEAGHLLTDWTPDSALDDAVFARHASGEHASANALWQVQAPSGLAYRPVLQGVGYALQHLASGRCLCATPAPAAAAEAADGGGNAPPPAERSAVATANPANP